MLTMLNLIKLLWVEGKIKTLTALLIFKDYLMQKYISKANSNNRKQSNLTSSYFNIKKMDKSRKSIF